MTNLLESLFYGKLCGWIFYPARGFEHENYLKGNDKLLSIYSKWEKMILSGPRDRPEDLSDINLFHEEKVTGNLLIVPSIEEQVRICTPKLGITNGKFKALASALDNSLDLIRVKGEHYSYTKDALVDIIYTFSKTNADDYPILYTIRSREMKSIF